LSIYSFEQMVSMIRAGEISPGDVIERSYDDDELAWEFGNNSLIRFAVGADEPGTYMSDPYWGLGIYLEAEDLLFAELATEGDGSDQTEFLGITDSHEKTLDVIANYIVARDFEMQFAVLNHFDCAKFLSWDFPPAEALDQFAWCWSNLTKKDLRVMDKKLTTESPVYRAFSYYFASPNDATWADYRQDFMKHCNLTKFYQDFK